MKPPTSDLLVETTVAVHMMLTILERSHHRLLVCAETNLAVDNLAQRFLASCGKDYGPIRLGRPSDDTNDDAVLEIVLEKRV